MSHSLKRSFSCKITQLSSAPSSCKGLDVVQLCAVIIRLPVSFAMLCDVGLFSLCTLGKDSLRYLLFFFCGVRSNCRELSQLKIIVENRCLSLWSNLLEFVTVVKRSNLLICLYAEVSKKCCLYSVKKTRDGY